MQTEGPLLQKKSPVLISACLLGIRCRYDGQNKPCSNLIDFAATIPFIPFCPEQMGGLPTPRPPANIIGGDGRDILSGNARIVDVKGKDVTEAFKRGAHEALKLAGLSGVSIAIMKEGSPSCGLKTSYCEKPSGYGIGITAALFESHGINMIEAGSNDTFPTRSFLELVERNTLAL